MQSGGGVMNVFGNKIKRLREEKNLTLSDSAGDGSANYKTEFM